MGWVAFLFNGLFRGPLSGLLSGLFGALLGSLVVTMPAAASYDDALAAFTGRATGQPDFARGERLLRSCAWQDDDIFCQYALGQIYAYGIYPSGDGPSVAGGGFGKANSGPARIDDVIEAYVWYFLASTGSSAGSRYGPIRRQEAIFRRRSETACRTLAEELNAAERQARWQDIRQRLEFILRSRGAAGYMTLGQLYLADQTVAGLDGSGGARDYTALLKDVGRVRRAIRDELIRVIGDVDWGRYRADLQDRFTRRSLFPFGGRISRDLWAGFPPETPRPTTDPLLDAIERTARNEIDGTGGTPRRVPPTIADSMEEMRRIFQRARREDWDGRPGFLDDARGNADGPPPDLLWAIDQLDELFETIEQGRKSFFPVTVLDRTLERYQQAYLALRDHVDPGGEMPQASRSDFETMAEIVARTTFVHDRLHTLEFILKRMQFELEERHGTENAAPNVCPSPFAMDMLAPQAGSSDSADPAPSGPDGRFQTAFRYFYLAELDSYPASDQIVQALEDAAEGPGLSGTAFERFRAVDWVYPPRPQLILERMENQTDARSDQEGDANGARRTDFLPPLQASLRYGDASIRLPEHEQELVRIFGYFPDGDEDAALAALSLVGCGERPGTRRAGTTKAAQEACIQTFQRTIGVPATGRLAPWELVHLFKLAARHPSSDYAPPDTILKYLALIRRWLGRFYFNGVGVPRDFDLAHDLFVLAAEDALAPDLPAMCYLHRIYSRNLVRPRNTRQTDYWTRKITNRSGTSTVEESCRDAFK